jgi:hypothetical protein
MGSRHLCLFLSDGRIEIDNNTVERTIRPIALNRKNARFAGHDAGAENWAPSVLSSKRANSMLSRSKPEKILHLKPINWRGHYQLSSDSARVSDAPVRPPQGVQQHRVGGGPGTVKTHVATALGVHAIKHHHKRVRSFRSSNW